MHLLRCGQGQPCTGACSTPSKVTGLQALLLRRHEVPLLQGRCCLSAATFWSLRSPGDASAMVATAKGKRLPCAGLLALASLTSSGLGRHRLWVRPYAAKMGVCLQRWPWHIESQRNCGGGPAVHVHACIPRPDLGSHVLAEPHVSTSYCSEAGHPMFASISEPPS